MQYRSVTNAQRSIWKQRRRLAEAWLADCHQLAEPRVPHTCPICGCAGVFARVGHPPRWDARCLHCGSRKRHRPLHLWTVRGGENKLNAKRILDDVRNCGLELANRVRELGFAVETFCMTPEEEVRYGLLRDEWLYVGSTKPLASVAGELDAREGRG